MSSTTVRLADLVMPAIFLDYSISRTKELTAFMSSGALGSDPRLDTFLSGAGQTDTIPFYNDLDAAGDPDVVGNDDPTEKITPYGISTGTEIQVRCQRNAAWSAMDIEAKLVGSDPMKAMVNLAAGYWQRRIQRMFLAVVAGVVANNATATDAYHLQNDMILDVSGSTLSEATKFSTSAFIDAQATMGDAQSDLTLCIVHSVVYSRMRKLQLIDFVQDATNPGAVAVPYYNGRRVIVDDSVPNSGGVFNTYLFATGAFAFGTTPTSTPVELDRDPAAGNGSGQTTFYMRMNLAIHPLGHAWIGTGSSVGGPTNAQLAVGTNWRRAWRERKMIGMAVLKTREL